MNRMWLGKWIGIFAVVGAGIWLLSCARSQKLEGITIQPGSGTFAAVDPTLFFQFKAFGAYIHPPANIDITNKVTWQTDNPQVVSVSSAGVVSPNTNCGTANVFATLKDGGNDVVSNSSTITVDGPASEGCPQGGATFNLSLSVTGGTFGTIVSSPAGISCGATCSAAFTTGTSVALTATALGGHSFAGWGSGCTSINVNTCNVTMNANITVTATFN
jgi:hypothetical protein